MNQNANQCHCNGTSFRLKPRSWRQHEAHGANHGTEVFELFTHNGVVVDDAASIVLTVRCTRIFHDDAGSVVDEFVRREPPSENDWEVRQDWPIEWPETHGSRRELQAVTQSGLNLVSLN